MNYTKHQLEEMMKRNGGSLYLRGTGITKLPDNLTVGGYLDLSGTGITELPDNLTVGGSLDLSGTGITVEERKKVKTFRNGDYKAGSYLYCDDILTHIKRTKKVGQYTFYQGKIKGKNVVSDGTYYAHCKTLKEGILDIEFKKSKERGAEQYSALALDSELTFDEAVTAYRIITGACRAGTQQFLDGLKEKKERYKVSEIIEKTRGQYGSKTFEEFFKRLNG